MAFDLDLVVRPRGRKREVAPADDENFTREYVLENGNWVPKK